MTLGPYTRQFEEAFGAAHGARHAVATSSGTSALEISLRAIGVAGRDVIIPANTFYATAAAVLRAGARPVFADIDAATFSLSPDTVTAVLTRDTAAVVVVHVGGLITPEIGELQQLCSARGITLIEDAAHAHGSTCDGLFAGSFGVASAFSFYPTKVVTCGEGGMILTGSPEIADEARIYRDQGKGSFGANHHVRHGYAWRMSEQNAVTGLVHLRRMDEFIARRREVAARYDKALAELDGLRALAEPPRCRSNIYKYIAVLPRGHGPRRLQAGDGRAPRRPAGRRGVRRPAAPAAGPGRVRHGRAAAGGRGHVRPACLPAGPLGHDRRRGRPGADRGRGRVREAVGIGYGASGGIAACASR